MSDKATSKATIQPAKKSGSKVFKAGVLTGVIGTLTGPHLLRWMGRRASLRLRQALPLRLRKPPVATAATAATAATGAGLVRPGPAWAGLVRVLHRAQKTVGLTR